MKTLWSRMSGLSAPAWVMVLAAVLSFVTVKFFLIGQVPAFAMLGASMTFGHVVAAILALAIAFLPCGLAWRLTRNRDDADARSASEWLTISGALMGGAMYAGVIMVLFEPGPGASPNEETLDVLLEMAVTVVAAAGMVAAVIGFWLAWMCLKDKA